MDNVSTITYQLPNSDVLVTNARAQLELVQSLVITDDGTYQMAATELAAIKGKRDRLEEQRMTITRPMDQAKQAVMNLFRPAVTLLDQAEAALKRSMIAYTTEQERKAAEARRQAEEAARKERERLQREAAEADAKARAQAEEQRRKAEEARAAGDTAKAAKLETKAAQIEVGAEQKVDSLNTQAQLVTAAPVMIAPVKAVGTSTRKKWKARCTDKTKLIAYVAANPQFAHILSVDESALNKLAGALEENFKVDGCEVYQEAILAARAA